MKKNIIRFKKTGRNILLFRGVTHEQAIEWCSSPITHKENVYFDGMQVTNTMLTTQKPKYLKYFNPSN